MNVSNITNDLDARFGVRGYICKNPGARRDERQASRRRTGRIAFQRKDSGSELTRVRHIILLAIAVVAVGSPGSAMAQDSSIDDGYAPIETTTTSRLPFSGLDLGLIAAGGALFVAAGVGLRRAARVD